MSRSSNNPMAMYGVKVGQQIRYVGDIPLKPRQGQDDAPAIKKDTVAVLEAIAPKVRQLCCKRAYFFTIRYMGVAYAVCPCKCRKVSPEYWVVMNPQKTDRAYGPMSWDSAMIFANNHKEWLEPYQRMEFVKEQKREYYPKYLHGNAQAEAEANLRADQACRPISEVLDVVKQMLEENKPEGGENE